ncbi:PAS domain-containing protein [Pseudemcibacter aquimaris]|uniref:PAS domain-containing protein n=1 Tax=Pseudemcibacter aquimaris TaxID=2857064 RepID=UPI002012D298|nr:PAS domain-containing protein [Pseudemcibacter aquimaris]MCC3861128.1 PAS domain-containing protein [Pseudemcibacter aquimaris]WDU59945.1 PAS domain-containing protein [Pseudemcibacter aquimaris]
MDLRHKISAPEQHFDFDRNELSSKEQLALYDYWLELKGSRDLPARSDFNPMKVPTALPYIVMQDVTHDPVSFKIRLIGSKSKVPSHYMGKSISDFPELWNVAEMLKQGIEYRKPYFYSNSISVEPEMIRDYTSLVLPFSEDGEKVNIVMGCLCFNSR